MEELRRIRRELTELDAATPAEPSTGTGAPGPAGPAESDAAVELDTIEVLGHLFESTGSRIQSRPAGRAIGSVERDRIDNVTGFSVKEIVEETPGVFLKQGNGPRDVGISIRGSGAKQAFGVRNIKVYEDGFPVTQSDGLSRTDITDPHAYEGVDVIRGPSSALYDNYALGGVANFRLRRGRDIDGIDLGNDFGSFGYQNHYVHIGGQHQALEYSLFGSHVRGDGWIDNSEFNTTTENLLATYTPDDTRSHTFKFINNDLETRVPSRLTLNELRANPRDAGKTFVNRPAGGGDTVDAELAAQGREDRRTIVGARYEHKLGSATDWRILGTYDVKDINQTFSTIGDNVNPNFQMATDLTHRNTLLGFNATHYTGLFFNNVDVESSSFFNRADGVPGRRGALQSQTRGYHRNFGGRVREEVQFSPACTGVLGVGAETSIVNAELRNRRAAEAYDIINVDREFLNVAPEAAVIFTPNDQLQVHGRVGTGYGIPGIGQLTATAPNGDPGNNTAIETQTNVGVELGADWQAHGTLGLSLTGYYEFFFNEFVTQFSSVTGRSFTDNAPEAEHRGIEAAIDWRPWDGWRMTTAYTFNDHIYTKFLETIGAGAIRQTLDRSGKHIPGVETTS